MIHSCIWVYTYTLVGVSCKTEWFSSHGTCNSAQLMPWEYMRQKRRVYNHSASTVNRDVERASTAYFFRCLPPRCPGGELHSRGSGLARKAHFMSSQPWYLCREPVLHKCWNFEWNTACECLMKLPMLDLYQQERFVLWPNLVLMALRDSSN